MTLKVEDVAALMRKSTTESMKLFHRPQILSVYIKYFENNLRLTGSEETVKKRFQVVTMYTTCPVHFVLWKLFHHLVCVLHNSHVPPDVLSHAPMLLPDSLNGADSLLRLNNEDRKE
ncbi:hypothetical protein DICVIV_13264 [Dictyocaulus viviparus]|uniref:Uncharacterized protein n=1 Tax=Dictyocaulus viviparus TaxID=29172 RepID=A0A0D8X887_DICVI|nr:hypothetical protein DICVIV_13264 [Dictyocaulus viviparus]